MITSRFVCVRLWCVASLFSVAILGSHAAEFPTLLADLDIKNVQFSLKVHTVVSSMYRDGGGIFKKPTTVLRYFEDCLTKSESSVVQLAVCRVGTEGGGASVFGVEFRLAVTEENFSDLQKLNSRYSIAPEAPAYLGKLMNTLCEVDEDELHKLSGGSGVKVIPGLVYGRWKNALFMFPRDGSVTDHGHPEGTKPLRYDIVTFKHNAVHRFNDVAIDPVLLRQRATGDYGVEDFIPALSEITDSLGVKSIGVRGMLLEAKGMREMQILGRDRNLVDRFIAEGDEAEWKPFLEIADSSSVDGAPSHITRSPDNLWRMTVMSEYVWRTMAKLRIAPEIKIRTKSEYFKRDSVAN